MFSVRGGSFKTDLKDTTDEGIRFSDAQIMAIVKQAEDGIPVAELCREHEKSDMTEMQRPAAFTMAGFFLHSRS